MGKSFAPVLADLFMGVWEEDMEQRARDVGGQMVFGARYMDDYIVGWRGSQATLTDFLANLNNKDPSIQLTLELEKDGAIPFLDLFIRRTAACFQTSVYRKPCCTNQAIPFCSFSDPRYLRGAVRADVVRAIRYSSDYDIKRKEMSFIFRKFLACGYPKGLISRVLYDTERAEERRRALGGQGAEEEEETNIRVSVPYTGASTHALRRAARKVGIELVSKPVCTLGSRHCSAQKHKLCKAQQSELVYGIDCQCGALYVGETGQELSDRIGAHERDWRKAGVEQTTQLWAELPFSEEEGTGRRRLTAGSVFASHPSCNPGFTMDKVKILGREKHHRLRLLHESAMIRTLGRRQTILVSPNDEVINRQSGVMLDDLWLPLLSGE